MFAPLIALAMSVPSQTATFEVVEVQTTKVFAGKRGHRVHREVTLRAEGRTITIYMQPYHDRFKPEPRTPSRGDRVRLSDLKA